MKKEGETRKVTFVGGFVDGLEMNVPDHLREFEYIRLNETRTGRIIHRYEVHREHNETFLYRGTRFERVEQG